MNKEAEAMNTKDQYHSAAPSQEARAGFTPGPWKVRKEWHGDGKEVFPDVKVSIGQPSELCVVSGIYDECTANARLIAAAPELLESLREVTQLLDMVLGVSGGYPRGADGPAVRARRAIRKATGEQA